jgi:carbonic anhydrase
MRHSQLLENNRHWAEERRAADPEFFDRLTREHKPSFLFIGCSDARVPANVITRTEPGEMFVHRNIANLVVPTDTNVLAVLQYAVEVLGVQDVIVCGHVGCGGVKASFTTVPQPHVDAWLANVRTVARLHHGELAAIEDEEARCGRLVELNVAEQVRNLARTPVVRAAWERGVTLRLHAWVYDLREGLLRPTIPTIADGAGPASGDPLRPNAVAREARRRTTRNRPNAERLG